MSILVDRNSKVITQGITGKTGQFHTRMCRDYANGRNCFVAGVIAASRAVDLKVPLVVRMKGTNEDLGKKILADSGLPIIAANNMAEAGEKVVAAARGAR